MPRQQLGAGDHRGHRVEHVLFGVLDDLFRQRPLARGCHVTAERLHDTADTLRAAASGRQQARAGDEPRVEHRTARPAHAQVARPFAANIARRCSRSGSSATALVASNTIVARRFASNAGQRGRPRVFGSPVRANASHASQTWSASGGACHAARPRRSLEVVEHERNLDRVRRSVASALERGLPTEVVEIHGAASERCPALRDFHDGRAVALVARNQEVEIRRRRTWIRA